MAAVHKATGNDHFAKKEWEEAVEAYTKAIEAENDPVSSAPLFSNRSAAYVHLDKLEEALSDADSCVERKPTWSKGYARLGEVYSRLQVFEHAVVAYEKAVERAEDPATKARYVTALRTTKQTQARNEKAYTKASGQDIISTQIERSTCFKVLQAIRDGYQTKPGGALQLMVYAHKQGEEGFALLDKCVLRQNGQDAGSPGSTACQYLSECLMLDVRAFIVPVGSDPSYPLHEKLGKLAKIDLFGLNLAQYNDLSRADAKAIISDFERRVPGEGWGIIRRSCSVLSRGNIITAFIYGSKKSYGNAIRSAKLAVDVLEEGNRVWSDVSYDDKGHSFKPTMIRVMRCYLMDLQLDASRDAFSESARKTFTLEAVEATARRVLADNPQSEWPTDRSDASRLAFHVLPTARAYLALAYASSRRAGAPLLGNAIPSGGAALANLDDARKAARYYDLAAKFLPDDDGRKPCALYMALEQHLRAGGKKVSEVFRLAEEAENLRKELARFFDELDKPYPPRSFVESQVEALRDWLSSAGARPHAGVPAVQQIIKPIPMLNLQGTPPTFNPNTVLDAQFWLALEGDVGLVDVLDMRQGLRGDYA